MGPPILSLTLGHSPNWMVAVISSPRDVFLPLSSFLLSSRCLKTFTHSLMILVLLIHRSHRLHFLFPATTWSHTEELPVGLSGRCHFDGSSPSGYLTLPDTISLYYLKENCPSFYVKNQISSRFAPVWVFLPIWGTSLAFGSFADWFALSRKKD